jgi:hypothetical protein
MSMTISPVQQMLRAIALVALVMGGWLIIMIAMPFVGPGGRDVAVVADRARALNAIVVAGGRVVDVRRGATLARSDKPGFVLALYAAGAPLVIEGRIAAGCFAKAGA